ncbi:MAG: hypothetical protein AB7Q17_18175 [Phycisphaerae bacterium]
MALGIFTHPVGAFAQLAPNDPWPKFARDDGNTCYTTVCGPHAPELRWWAKLGTAGAEHAGGAVIATIDDVNYAFVGTPTTVNSGGVDKPRVYIFKMDDAGHSRHAATAPVCTITLPEDDDFVRSTLLVTQDRWLIVQTTERLLAYDVSGLPDCNGLDLTWSSEPLQSNRSSPTIGRISRDPEILDVRVFALGVAKEWDNVKVAAVSIEPNATGSDRSFDMVVPLRPQTMTTTQPITTWTCPALGAPNPGDDAYASGVNLLYCSTLGSPSESEDHFFTIFADNTPRYSLPTALAWSARFDPYGPFKIGTYGSPSVFPGDADVPSLRGAVVVGADDGGLFGIPNASIVNPSDPFRWTQNMGGSISETAALTPRGEILYKNEEDFVQYVVDDIDEDDDADLLDEVDVAKTNHLGGGSADDYRHYTGTDAPTTQPTGDLGRIHGSCYALDSGPSGTILKSWKYLPPDEIDGEYLRRGFMGAIAMDSDGSLLAVRNGYILKLGHLRGDFNADGCRDETDVDAFTLALVDLEEWEQCYGIPARIDLLGIGDCNRDGYFNNLDIGCMADLLTEDPYCGPEDYVPCSEVCQPEQSARSGDSNYFWNAIAALYIYFNM